MVFSKRTKKHKDDPSWVSVLMFFFYLMECVVQLLATAAWDVGNALLMAAAGKLSLEELVKALTANILLNETTWEDDDVGVVVLADEVGNLWTPYEASTDLLMLVERHSDAFARATHGNAWIALASLNGIGQSVSVSGIVARLFGQGAIVMPLDTLLVEILLDKLLEWESSVITGKTHKNLDFHRTIYYLRFTIQSM